MYSFNKKRHWMTSFLNMYIDVKIEEFTATRRQMPDYRH